MGNNNGTKSTEFSFEEEDEARFVDYRNKFLTPSKFKYITPVEMRKSNSSDFKIFETFLINSGSSFNIITVSLAKMLHLSNLGDCHVKWNDDSESISPGFLTVASVKFNTKEEDVGFCCSWK